jgi:ribonuclease E
MAKRMLIDAMHPEETRVVVLNGNKLEEFDFETSTKKQLKGNIYLAKVTRVEPSLQAAFVDYGGNRHGFLAFNEIHPDYWRIPVADREALLAEQNAAHDHEGDEEPRRHRRRARPDSDTSGRPDTPLSTDQGEHGAADTAAPHSADGAEPDENQPSFLNDAQRAQDPQPPLEPQATEDVRSIALDHDAGFSTSAPPSFEGSERTEQSQANGDGDAGPATAEFSAELAPGGEAPLATPEPANPQNGEAPAPAESAPSEASVESIGGDDIDEMETRRRYRPMRHYKIQEVIKRRQVLLVQVVKEERGTKGAALTTYLSLAGRYCVLMPNTARGGGISRRITSAQDRKRLKSIMEELAMPEGTAIILRTAGMERSKPEIKRDYEYLQRQWDDIRELTLKSTAPCLVYEEGSLIKRAIRDLYARDIEDIQVEGEEGYKVAKNFMKTLMPSHMGRIQLYNDPTVPLFQRFQVEAQLDEMHSPTVRLRSGGYIVINPTEALVSIDVNSGRATRERHIEETAYKTNLEAADEIARQLRLRDLAGLIVIDFIDMEETRNQHSVERRLKEAMKIDRARIQIGRISPFGLLELSRQRLRPSLQEVSTERCPHCGGTGLVRSTESTALHVLRAIEEEGMKMRTIEATVHVPTAVAIYILNQKRDSLINIEQRYGLRVAFSRDDALIPPAYRLDRTRARTAADPMPVLPPPAPAPVEIDEPIPAEDIAVDGEFTAADAPFDDRAHTAEPRAEQREGFDDQGGDNGGGRRRRRRRRGRGRDGEERGGPPQPHREQRHFDQPHDATGMPDAAPAAMAEGGEAMPQAEGGAAPTGEPRPHHPQQHDHDGEGARRRRRGRRGGRRRGRRDGEPPQPHAAGPQDPFVDPRYPDAAAPPREDEAATAPIPPAAPALREPPPPRRIEGPGDAYDWPWNRRAERFPDEVAREAEIAREAEVAREAEAAQPFEAPAPAESAPMSSAPRVAELPREPESAPLPPRERPVAEDIAPPVEETPAGPPRKGWWRRLTQ